jgi:hypothetical protein
MGAGIFDVDVGEQGSPAKIGTAGGQMHTALLVGEGQLKPGMTEVHVFADRLGHGDAPGQRDERRLFVKAAGFELQKIDEAESRVVERRDGRGEQVRGGGHAPVVPFLFPAPVFAEVAPVEGMARPADGLRMEPALLVAQGHGIAGEFLLRDSDQRLQNRGSPSGGLPTAVGTNATGLYGLWRVTATRATQARQAGPPIRVGPAEGCGFPVFRT